MRIIPVIDIKAGKVVRASGGDRRNYQPWLSPICPNADPLEAVEGFLGVHPFPRIYIADLDGIETGARQTELLHHIKRAHPSLELWVDNGLTRGSEWPHDDIARLVIGSESLRPEDPFDFGASVLSLDFRRGVFLGPPPLMQSSDVWPGDVIVMSLDVVGGARGPDVERLVSIRAMAPGLCVYAAGGVRGADDMQALATLGVDGALIATALHERRLSGDDFTRFGR